MIEMISKVRSKRLGRVSLYVGQKLKYWARREWDYLRINPVDALFFLTYRCTSHCRTCTMWKRGGREYEIDLKGWKIAVDNCYRMGVRWIEIFGGDALLRKDVLVPITEYIKGFPGLECNIPTNSNLMDDETADGLVNAQMDDVWVSMDGISSVHDEVRGTKGTFERVSRCVELLLAARGDKSKPKIRANCTISKYNADTFHEVLPYAEERGLDSVHLEYVGEFWQKTLDKSSIDGVKPTPYFIQQDGESVLVNKDQAHKIKRQIEIMKQQAKGMKTALLTENVDKLTIENMVKGRFDNKRCYITRCKVSIDPFGNVLGCPFYGDWKMGNVLEQPLHEIWGNEKHKQFIMAFENGQLPFCNYCILGVQRNPTLFQDIRDEFNRLAGRARM